MVDHSDHRARKPFSTTGIFANARSILRFPGFGAHSARLGTFLTGVALALAALVPSPANAAFTRPFLRQLTGTAPGSPFNFRPVDGGGIAVDSEDNLWVANPEVAAPPFFLDRFDSSGNFLSALPIEGAEPAKTPPLSLAIDNVTGAFYTAGDFNINYVSKENFGGGYLEAFDKSGAFNKQWHMFGGRGSTAVDNSAEPSAGTVYVSHSARDNPPEFHGDGLPSGVEKFNALGEPINFSGSAPYISGNEITGDPHATFESGVASPGSVTVDSHGNIYVTNAGAREGVPGEEPTASAVDEYKPSGVFVRAFTFKQTPGLGGSHESGGAGGNIGEGAGLAVDPVSGHVLVAVNRFEAVRKAAIDEFSSTGEYLNQITEISPGHPLHHITQMAVDAQGDLYFVEDDEHVVDAFGPGHFLPSLKIGEATQRQPASALLNGSVDPEGFSLTDCHFEYVSEAAYQVTGFSDLSSGGESACSPSAESMPVDSEFHPISSELAGLVSGTTYRYRLLATTSGALGGLTVTNALAFTAPHAPTVQATFIDNLSSTFADLHATVDPLGADTTYQFQYVDAAHYEPAAEDPYAAGWVAPPSAVDIGSGGPTGGASEAVLQQIGGLQPGTAYHLRILASNEYGITAGPDETFTTLPQVSPGLPDQRAYELLTPPNKGGAGDMFAEPVVNLEFPNVHNVGYPSETGDGFLFETRAAFGTFPASAENAYVFTRDPQQHRWTDTSLASPSLGVQSLSAPVFDPADLSLVGIADGSGSTASTTGAQELSLLGPPGGPYATLHSDAPAKAGESDREETAIVGGSRDLSDVVVQSKDHTLTSAAEGLDEGSTALYEWFAGKFKLINLNSKGALLNRCGAVLGLGTHEGLGNLKGGTHSAVSADGSQVFFTSPDPNMSPTLGGPGGPGCWNGATGSSPQVYLRSGKVTIEVSAPESGVTDSSGTHISRFVGASEDGSRAFFVTETELTASDEGIHDPELYEWRSQGTLGAAGACATSEGCLARISTDESGNDESGVYAVPAVSNDGSAIYFAAFGRLTFAAPPSLGGNEINLYRYATSTGALVYVATVDTRDFQNGVGGANHNLAPSVGPDPVMSYYMTPNGRFLLFGSIRSLTGYDNSGPCYVPNDPGGEFGHRCSELYRYDSTTTSLACLSCNPSGAPPVSHALFARSALSSAPAGPVRAMSNDGSSAFFDSADALVPQDTNGTLDVYEWHDGRISLISTGHGSAPSFFLGASADGSNVFLGTHSRLVPEDTDTAGDLYDARIGGGFPVGSGLGPCEGDACSNPSTAPPEPTLSSSVPSGSGNKLPGPPVKPKKCRKGFVRKRGKCVRKHHKRAAHNNRGGRR